MVVRDLWKMVSDYNTGIRVKNIYADVSPNLSHFLPGEDISEMFGVLNVAFRIE